MTGDDELKFNLAFDEALGKELIATFQLVEHGGCCFTCRKPNPAKTCSRCKIAKYCSKECQKKDWKNKDDTRTDHKELCETWCDNRAASATDRGLCIPICMAGCHYISEDELMTAMNRRRELFFEEFKRCSSKDDLSDKGARLISFASSVVHILGKLRLVGAASFYSTSLERVVMVNHILFEDVGEGTNAAVQRLYPSHGGSGQISDATKKRVIQAWSNFVKRMSHFGLIVNSITVGRGLMWLVNDEESQKATEKHGIDGIWGKNRINWMPSTDYAMTDSMATAFSAAFGT